MLDLLLMDIEDWITDACINAEPEQSLRFGQSSEDVKKPPIDGKPPVVSGAIAAASEASYKATVSSTGSSDTTGARRTTAGRKEL
ncbi:hypothetical protein N9K47_00105 [bacterium]|nr:hypothetical protein [bacterium]